MFEKLMSIKQTTQLMAAAISIWEHSLEGQAAIKKVHYAISSTISKGERKSRVDLAQAVDANFLSLLLKEQGYYGVTDLYINSGNGTAWRVEFSW